jgi:GNAT superfamily N-acetyltransferase
MKCPVKFTVEADNGGPVDLDAIAGLLTELGYPRDRAFVQDRIRLWRADPDTSLLLARANGHTVGLLALRFIPSFERAMRFGRIMVLSVAAGARRSGIATALVKAAVNEAEAAGCCKLEVCTNGRRSDAHSFYEDTGFVQTHRYYAKPLKGYDNESHPFS